MVLIKYNGTSVCRIKILNTIIRRWGPGEVKNLDDKSWQHLKSNKLFSIAGKVKKELEKPKPSTSFDLDGDGDVDKDDYSIAAKVLASARKKKKEEVK